MRRGTSPVPDEWSSVCTISLGASCVRSCPAEKKELIRGRVEDIGLAPEDLEVRNTIRFRSRS